MCRFYNAKALYFNIYYIYDIHIILKIYNDCVNTLTFLIETR